MRRLGFIAALAVAFTTLAVGTAQAATSDNSTDPIVKKYESTANTYVGIRPAVTTLDDPPGQGCNATIQFNTTATYDGTTSVLESTETSYSGNVICTTTAAGQTMASLDADANMFINGNLREPDAPNAHCQHFAASDPLCLDVASTSSAFCFALSERCDGLYSAAEQYALLLPDGWVYTSWPENCDDLGSGGQELLCNIGTESREIPPVA